MIKVLVLDVDGVMTDGKVMVNTKGEEFKTFCYKDFDAFGEFKKRGLLVCAITGEDTQLAAYIKNRLNWDYFYSGVKEKAAAVQEIIVCENLSWQNVCYIGDGKYDIGPLEQAGLSVCPKDAIGEVKKACDVVLSRNGGEGCVWELVNIIDEYNGKNKLTCRKRDVIRNEVV